MFPRAHAEGVIKGRISGLEAVEKMPPGLHIFFAGQDGPFLEGAVSSGLELNAQGGETEALVFPLLADAQDRESPEDAMKRWGIQFQATGEVHRRLGSLSQKICEPQPGRHIEKRGVPVALQ
jgi:hypothetical protein